MLQPILETLNSKRIILASGSPRRHELIKNLGITAEVCPSLFEENLKQSDYPRLEDYVTETALQKVLEVSARLNKENYSPDIIIGADTMVALNGVMFGKPTDEEDAFNTLSTLSGKWHMVYTGVVIKTNVKKVVFCETAKVFIAELTPDQIKGYIATGHPMDKAGSYGIQGLGGSLIERIDGDFFTVVGLPLSRVCKTLTELHKNNEL